MILVLVEHDNGRPRRASLQALAFGRGLAQELGLALTAVAVGTDAGAGLAGALDGQGLAGLTFAVDPRLAAYSPGAWASAISGVVTDHRPAFVVAAATDVGNEVLASAAARLGLPFLANCVGVAAGDPVLVTRQAWGGSVMETCVLAEGPRLLSIAPEAPVAARAAEHASPPGGPLAVRTVPATLDREPQVRLVAHEAGAAAGVELADARVVVGGGRGMGSDGFDALDDLAVLLHGTVGVSRAVTSAGWRPHAEQIGQTGARIAPDLYIACGISGAIQHMVGVRRARRILAINTDPDAPIMGAADFAVLGDARTVVPAIAAELRRRGIRAG